MQQINHLRQVRTGPEWPFSAGPRKSPPFSVNRSSAAAVGAAAGTHQCDVGAGEPDIAEQVVVILDQVGEDLLAFRAVEQGCQDRHVFSFLFWLPCGVRLMPLAG